MKNPFLLFESPLKIGGRPGRLLLVVLCAMAMNLPSFGREWRVAQIPNGNRFGCANCHVSSGGGGSRNPFGQAVEQRVSPGGAEEFWDSQLAALESDGDGFSNGTELGDPDGDGQPTAGAQVTNPGNASSRPTTPQAPVVTITAPANNSTVTLPSTVTVSANATVTGSTISSVEFLSGSTSLGTDNAAPYSVEATLAAGTHVLTARATAANGQATTSGGVTITVTAEPAGPVVAITAPANNATLSSTNVTITASASVEGGTITMVEFFDGTTFLDMAHGEPFTVTVNLATGQHVLTAKATANSGMMVTSAPVRISINLGVITNAFPPMARTDMTIELQTVAEGMVAPLGLVAPNDGSNRLFVFDQIGLIHVVTNGIRLETPLLDMQSRLVPLQAGYDERGLLGLAVHPDFATNGLIYTYSSEPTSVVADFPSDPGTSTNNHQTVVAEWRIDSANMNRVDPASRREVLRMDQPQFNHNGGVMHFGMDGMLYLALGDGGNRDDEGLGHSPQGNGQDLNKILGKVIRIDVNGRTSPNGQYAVPGDNPFVGVEGLDEIWAYGFRNPYSWSFDKLTGEMYVGDVGQGTIEEVDRVFKGGNYGWPIKEGSFYFDPAGPTGNGFITTIPAVETVPPNLVDPIAEYDHDEGLSIIGGYMYRGTSLPNLIGRYVTADFGRFNAPVGRLFVVDRSEFRELRLGVENRIFDHWIKGFGQDQQGELYVFASTNLGPSGTSGKMLKIVPAQYEIQLSGIEPNGTNVVATWSDTGVGPFVLEGKTSLEERAWRVVGAAATNFVSVPADTSGTFMRLRDAAGIRDSAFTVYMTGAAERPTPVANENGLGLGTLVIEGNTLHFDIRYSGLTGPAVAAHIHGPASAEEAADVLINLGPFNGGGFATSGVLSGAVTLTPAQKAAILAGKTYVNVHTALNGAGEIRGQVAPMLWITELSGDAERPNPVTTEGRGSGLLMLVGNKLTFDIEYSDLKTNAHLAHIHGPANANAAAPVLVDLAPFNGGAFGSNGTFSGTVTLTPAQIAALVDGLTYVNVHTPAPFHPSGEIRGQIWPKSTAIPLTATLSGAAERPEVDTSALGSGTFALDGNRLHFNVTYRGLKQTANSMHIHGPATAATSTNVMIDLGPSHVGEFGTNGAIAGTVVLTDPQRAAILEGRTYVNVHSGAHPSGEIRGQVIPSVMHTVLLGASERPAAVHLAGRGRGSLLLAGDDLWMNVTYSGLTGPAVAAHIHGPAPTSAAATVMVGLDTLNGGAFGASGSFAGSLELTTPQISALVDGLTYINVHTGANGGGETRGQIVR